MADDIPDATDLKTVDLDPKLVNTIGLHHSLPTALADLVDNSLDAHASTIRIRFLLQGSTPVGLQVIDDGDGMDDQLVDRAMMYAGTRKYGATDLGHFGVGLKAASLSQASTVLIYSRMRGLPAVGRKLVRSENGRAPQVGIIDSSFATARIDSTTIGVNLDHGTIIEWREVRTFPSTADEGELLRWHEGAVRDVRAHLGLVLHRILAAEGPEVSLDSFDLAYRAAGAARAVEPIDPFGYRVSGDVNYPQDLRISLADASEPIHARAHIWPPKSQDPAFKLGGQPGVGFQGCYVYRRGRLLQVGGWCGLFKERPEWELARIEIDLTSTAEKHVTINPEKSGIEFSADLKRALEKARCVDTGDSLKQYLVAATGERARARSRTRKGITVVQPVGGLPSAVNRAYRKNVNFDPDHPGVAIRWRRIASGDVFRVDTDNGVLELNLAYREILVGEQNTNAVDAPVIKVLFHLLMEHLFSGHHHGPKDKAEIAAWQQILFAAVVAQGERMGWELT